MRFRIIVLWMLLCWVTSAAAQVSIGVAVPGVSIGINLSSYPQLVAVPGYPVYYAPGLPSNYFFYDGMYWVYQRDNWYASSWYNGPWGFVGPEFVPLFVLRVPVRYYRQPPVYFRGWQSNAPPRWGEHWGHEWEQHRSGWDRWNRSAVPAPAPLPSYQRQYSGDRYPHQVEQQHALQSQNYRYQPRDAVVREQYRQQGARPSSASAQRGAPMEKSPKQQETSHSNSPPPVRQSRGPGPPPPPSQSAGEEKPRSDTGRAPAQQGGPPVQSQRPPQQQQESAPREQQMPRSQAPDGNAQGKGSQHEKDRDKGDERGQDHNK
jgi:hypothetical protein